MSLITAVRVIRLPEHAVWVLLDCGHRWKLTGGPRPSVGSEIACPDCEEVAGRYVHPADRPVGPPKARRR